MRLILICTLIIMFSCRGEEFVVPEEQIPVDTIGDMRGGIYLLNEGNMGSNKCALDYYDYSSGIYHRNIYAERNPGVVKELGDVGNDIGIYGSKLYAVINGSNLIEVMDVKTARHIGSIQIPNCRYITFNKGKAYVSSYAGPIQTDPNARPGYVAEIDTISLTVNRTVVVGYQPEEMAVVGNKLYVANSGGYRVPNYDRTVSVIDLSSFTEINKIDVAINLHRLKADKHGYIYVNSRGDNNKQPSNLYVINSKTDQVEGKLDVAVSNFCVSGDSIYLYSLNETTREVAYVLIDIPTRKIISRNFIKDKTETQIMTPFGIAVNPLNKDIFITDAKSYVVPGKLYCFSREGKKKWDVVTGDAPAHMVFTEMKIEENNNIPGDDDDDDTGKSPYITKVIDFLPAPGQFVNDQPTYSDGDSQAAMNQKVLEAIGNNNRGLISLGGYGGYVVVGFDHTIRNISGEKDIRVLGNAFSADINRKGGSAEPGIISVAYDHNKNGYPDDDEWYELAGSEFHKTETLKEYVIRYIRPDENKQPVKDPNSPTITDSQYIRWNDNRNENGFIPKLAFHAQSYYPGWITADELVFHGTRLAPNGKNEGTGNIQNWILMPYDWGYADNLSNKEDGSCFDIGWAVDKQGNPVELPGADFIKIYTGVNQICGWTGEISTEVMGVTDLHLEKSSAKNR